MCLDGAGFSLKGISRWDKKKKITRLRRGPDIQHGRDWVGGDREPAGNGIMGGGREIMGGGQGNYAEGQASGGQKGLGGRIPREVLIISRRTKIDRG
jgi:hypothetical protein